MARTPPRRSTIAVAGAVLAAALPAVGSAAPAVHVRESGVVHLLHADDFADGRASAGYVLVSSAGAVGLSLAPGAAAPLPGGRVVVSGRRSGRRLIADSISTPADAPRFARSLSRPLTGAKRVAVVLFGFPGGLGAVPNAATALATMATGPASLAAWFTEASAGAVQVTTSAADVYGPVLIADSSAPCGDVDIERWFGEANAAAGLDLARYDAVVYSMAQQPACGFAGAAETPGTRVIVNGEFDVRVLAHELGHNFGLQHAGAESCRAGSVSVAISSTCTHDEYGDPFDAMGGAARPRHYSTFHADQVGWLGAGQAQTVTTSGAYAIGPNGAPGGPTALRIARGPGTGMTSGLCLEYRQTSGTFDDFLALSGVVSGVSVRLCPSASTSDVTGLLDMVPATADLADASLAVGRTFTDTSGIVLTTTAVTPVAATVAITVPAAGAGSPPPAPPRDTTPPGPPGPVVATSSARSGVELRWTPAADDVGVVAYLVLREGARMASTAATTYVDAVAPGSMHDYAVAAVDAAGNVGPPTAAVSISTPWPPDPRVRVTARLDRRLRLHLRASVSGAGDVRSLTVEIDGRVVARLPGALRLDRTLRVRVGHGHHRVRVTATGTDGARTSGRASFRRR